MSWIYAGEGECHFELYEEVKHRFGQKHNLRCLNGRYTSSSKCVGFCFCDDHPGFITEKLKQEHHCAEYNCRYYLAKPARIRTIKTRRQKEHIYESGIC